MDAKSSAKWAAERTKEIFSGRGLRHDKETMVCTRCSHLPESLRGSDWQLPLGGITKAKVHLAVHCTGLGVEEGSEDARLRHVLLVTIPEKSMTSKKAKQLQVLSLEKEETALGSQVATAARASPTLFNSAKSQWAVQRTKEIFSLEGERNGKETMMCTKCMHLPPESRGKDWQVPKSGITKAKIHLAVYCNGMRPEESEDDSKLKLSLLLIAPDGSLVSKKAKGLKELALQENARDSESAGRNLFQESMTDWAVAKTKEIFGLRGQRHGKETMMCSRCFGLPESDRGADWQLPLSGITKAKVHLAVHCTGLQCTEGSEDAKLRRSLLLTVPEKALHVTHKARAARSAALEAHKPDTAPGVDYVRAAWATNLTKEIFSQRGERHGKVTMVCSRCSHLPEVDRGADFQLPLSGITKAKVHLAVYCNGLRVGEVGEDAKLRHTLLLMLSEKSIGTRRAKAARAAAVQQELYPCNSSLPPVGKGDPEWATRLAKEIFSVRGERGGRETMMCSRCCCLPESQRFADWQLPLGATTRAKVHLAVFCAGLQTAAEGSEDARLRHTLLISIPEKSLVTKKARAARLAAEEEERRKLANRRTMPYGARGSAEWAVKVTKEIFSQRGERHGKETMVCSRCALLPEDDRGVNWQLPLTGITKAKAHLAVHCTSLYTSQDDDDMLLRNTLLLTVPDKSLQTKKAKRLRAEAQQHSAAVGLSLHH